MLALQFIPQADLAVREMRRVTRPGGTVAAGHLGYARRVRCPTHDFRRGGHARSERARGQSDSLHEAHEPPRGFGARWHDAGLTDIVQDMLTIRMDFASFADFWAPLEGKEGPVAEYVGTLGVRYQSEAPGHG